MAGYDIEVKLLAVTPESENLIEQAGRLCYDTDKIKSTTPGWIGKRISQGHESIIEHGVATFYIRCSRVVTHELVRHRLASYSQRSQRYVNESKSQYITPSELTTLEQIQVYVLAMENAWEAYQLLLLSGIKPEIARYVLPNACETKIICTWNFREIRHIIKLRTSPAALPEMREVAGYIRDIMVEKVPAVFEDLKI